LHPGDRIDLFFFFDHRRNNYREDPHRPPGVWGARHVEYHVAHETLERIIFDELLVDLRIFLQQSLHNFAQRLIVRHPRRMGGVCLGILVGRVSRNFRGNVLSDTVHHAVGIGKQGAEGLIEIFENIAQTIELGLGLAAMLQVIVGLKRTTLQMKAIAH
jgi:hypothetical protein